MIEVVLAVYNLVEDLVTCVTLEREITTHEYIENDSERPDITLAIKTTLEHLRRHVVRCTGDAVDILLLLVLSLRQTEINELKLTLLRHHDVLARSSSSLDSCLTMSAFSAHAFNGNGRT